MWKPSNPALDARHDENCDRIIALLLEGAGHGLLGSNGQPLCSITDCGKTYYSTGMCRFHYGQRRRALKGRTA